MKAPPCARSWEAEAIEDGRLDESASRASFERHAAACGACANERRSLARIRKAVETLPAYPSQAIDRRRSRMVLLQRANEQLMRGRGQHVGVWTFAACAIVLAIVGLRWGTSRHLSSPPARVPAFEVVEVGHASWTTTAVAGAVHVALSDGTTAVHVEHLTHDQEFLVELPDGQLEVRGTRFQVSVVGKRTTHVEVREGVVALRLAGQPQTVLTAGQKWSSDELATTEAPPPPDEIAFLMPPAQAGELAVVKARSSPIASHPPSRAEPAQTPPETGAPTNDPYPSCISAFQAGDYLAANRLLSAFVRDNPSDARSEDAAFLLAVAHSRMGDAAGAARLAEDYLRQYPTGLRYKEAERLARDAGPSVR